MATDLWGFINEVKKAFEAADKERLSVMWPDFQAEFPELVEEIFFCAKMPNAGIVKRYLVARDPRFAGLLLVPNVDQIIQFLMNFINDRSAQNAAIPLPVSSNGDVARSSSRRPRRYSS